MDGMAVSVVVAAFNGRPHPPRIGGAARSCRQVCMHVSTYFFFPGTGDLLLAIMRAIRRHRQLLWIVARLARLADVAVVVGERDDEPVSVRGKERVYALQHALGVAVGAHDARQAADGMRFVKRPEACILNGAHVLNTARRANDGAQRRQVARRALHQQPA
eukprot:1777704-Pleurochrysis_carterae.AAC.4